MSGLDLFNKTVRATARFASPSSEAILTRRTVVCPFCKKDGVDLGGNNCMAQHMEGQNGFTICPASGKTEGQAELIQLDENYLLPHEEAR